MKPPATAAAREPQQRSVVFAAWAFVSMLLAFGSAHAQTLVPTTVAVGGVSQTVSVGSVLPQRFVVRISDAQGQTLVGVRVRFNINLCFEGVPPPGGGCPPAALYGRFNTSNFSSEVLSDGNGLATSDAFVAGSVAGQYQIFSSIPQQQVGSVQIPFNTVFSMFQVNQVLGGLAPSASGIPTTSGWGLVGMMLLLALVAMIRLKNTAA